MNRELVDQWIEWGILGLVLSSLIFGALATGAVRQIDFLVIQTLTAGVAALWVLRLWVGKQKRLLWPPICWAVLAFVSYALLRYSQADVEYVARLELIKILVYAVLFLAVLQHLHRQETVQLVVFVLIGLGTLVSLYAIYQFATNSPYVWHFLKPAQYMKRGSGTFICPNHLAGFLEMILPLALAYVFVGRFRPLTKVFLGYAALMILAGLAVSGSRGGWLATGLSLLLFFGFLIRRPGYRLPALAFLLIVLGVGAIFVARSETAHRRLERRVRGETSEEVRFLIWGPAVRMWEDHLWLGVGPAHFDLRFPQYRPDAFQLRPDRVHNDYLNTLADWGIVGATLVAAAWVALGFSAVRTWKYVQRSGDLGSRKSNKPALLLGAATGLLAILLHSAVDFNMHIPANAMLAVTLMALIAGHIRFATDRFWFRNHWALRAALSALLLAGGIYLGQQGVLRYQEQTLLRQAGKKPSLSTLRITTLQKAFAVEPMNSKTAQDIAEAFRLQSWQGNDDYRELAENAMHWFQTAMRLNRYDPYNPLRYGMCLHWINRHSEAQPYFDQALQLDPHGYYTIAHMGWHWVQLGDYAQAKVWFERSLRLPTENPIAYAYLRIVNQRLAEKALNK